MGTDPPFEIDDGDLRAVLRAALAGGAEFAELFVERRRSRGLRLDDGRIEDLVAGLDVGAGVRVVNGMQTGYAYTNVLRRDSLVDAARAAAAAVTGSHQVTVADLTTVEASVTHPVRDDPFAVDGPALADIARRAEDAARSCDPAVRQATVMYGDVSQRILLANSEGHRHTEDRVRTRIVAQAVAARDGDLQTGHEVRGASVGHELFDDYPPERIGRQAAEHAVLLLDAAPAPTGSMPVVLAPGSGGVLFHEACGHGMEADIVAREASVYRGRQGERIGTPTVSVVDDATLVGHWGSFAFDDEGTPAQRTVLFDRGVCTDYMTDRLRARQLGIARSGNARRQSYADLPIPRMTNTFIVPGDDDKDAIVADIDYGLYCDVLGGGQVDPASGDFVFGVSVAHLIENGEITTPVRGASLVGDGPSVLAAVDAVSDDFDVRQGTCGKDGQGVPAGLGNPTLRIARLTVGGPGDE
jgi:TldD protein